MCRRQSEHRLAQLIGRWSFLTSRTPPEVDRILHRPCYIEIRKPLLDVGEAMSALAVECLTERANAVDGRGHYRKRCS
jgi:hypothetical protein